MIQSSVNSKARSASFKRETRFSSSMWPFLRPDDMLELTRQQLKAQLRLPNQSIRSFSDLIEFHSFKGTFPNCDTSGNEKTKQRQIQYKHEFFLKSVINFQSLVSLFAHSFL